ncbi:MAG: hypothetical protein CL675_00885 [Bdellovibrionaceae bacterium]|nr:hypothetical protein [Pseudobdellovibrionaceae bacterium]
MIGLLSLILFYQLNISSANELKETRFLTLDQIEKLVESNNTEVKSARLQSKAAKVRSGHFLRSLMPKLQGKVGYESFETGPYSTRSQAVWKAEASVNIYRGGRDVIQSEIFSAQERLAQISKTGTKLEVRAEAESLYWHHVALNEAMVAYKKFRKLNESNFKAAKTRINRGVSTETDRIEFEIYRGQVDESLESYSHEAELVRAELAPILGIDVGFSTTDYVPHDDEDPILKAENNQLSSKKEEALRLQGRIEELSADLSQRWWRPTADVYAGQEQFNLRERTYFSSDYRLDTYVGVRLTFNFDPFNTGVLAEAQTMEHKAHAKRYQQQLKNLKGRIEKVHGELKHEHDLIHLSENRIKQGESYYIKTLDEYRRGVKNSVDVLNATQKYLGFHVEHIERRRNYQLIRAQLVALLNNKLEGEI